jgi:hypothetical protein
LSYSSLTGIIEKESQKYPVQLLQPGKPYFSPSLHVSHGEWGSPRGFWLYGPSAERLLWFPSQLKSRLPMPYLLAIRGKEMIQFDTSTFHHGKEWTKCCTGS